MERRDVQIGLAVLAAAAIGFLLALVAFGGDDTGGTQAAATGSTTTTSTTATTATGGAQTTATTVTSGTTTTPGSPEATPASCIALWNQPSNRGAQTFLVNIASQQAIRVHAGATSEVPPKCLVTVIANNGDAYVFAEGGGATYPYVAAPTRTTASDLPEAQRSANALEQRDGTLAEH